MCFSCTNSFEEVIWVPNYFHVLALPSSFHGCQVSTERERSSRIPWMELLCWYGLIILNISSTLIPLTGTQPIACTVSNALYLYVQKEKFWCKQQLLPSSNSSTNTKTVSFHLWIPQSFNQQMNISSSFSHPINIFFLIT